MLTGRIPFLAPPSLPAFTLVEGSKVTPTLIPPQPRVELELFVSQPDLRGVDFSARAQWLDLRRNGNGTIPHQAGNFTLVYSWMTNAERDDLLTQLTTLRQALNNMLFDIGSTVTIWTGLTAPTQEHLRRLFGNGNALDNSQLHQVRSYLRTVLNAYDAPLGFQHAYNGNLGWAVPGMDIRLGLPYADLNAKNKVGTLLHEMIHKYNWVTDKGYFRPASLLAGPQGGPRPLPVFELNDVNVNLTVSELLRNPDSYAGFMMDYYLS